MLHSPALQAASAGRSGMRPSANSTTTHTTSGSRFYSPPRREAWASTSLQPTPSSSSTATGIPRTTTRWAFICDQTRSRFCQHTVPTLPSGPSAFASPIVLISPTLRFLSRWLAYAGHGPSPPHRPDATCGGVPSHHGGRVRGEGTGAACSGQGGTEPHGAAGGQGAAASTRGKPHRLLLVVLVVLVDRTFSR